MALNEPYLKLDEPEPMNPFNYHVYTIHYDNPLCPGHDKVLWTHPWLPLEDLLGPGET